MSETWLVAHDFSPCSDVAAKEAARLVDKIGGKLLLLHVYPVARVRPEAQWGEATFAVEEQARTRLADVAAALKKAHPKLDASVAVITGDTPTAILNEADRQKVSHIVVGTHGRTGLEGLVLGSWAELIARQANCPVTIVRVAKG